MLRSVCTTYACVLFLLPCVCLLRRVCTTYVCLCTGVRETVLRSVCTKKCNDVPRPSHVPLFPCKVCNNNLNERHFTSLLFLGNVTVRDKHLHLSITAGIRILHIIHDSIALISLPCATNLASLLCVRSLVLSVVCNSDLHCLLCHWCLVASDI